MQTDTTSYCNVNGHHLSVVRLEADSPHGAPIFAIEDATGYALDYFSFSEILDITTNTFGRKLDGRLVINW